MLIAHGVSGPLAATLAFAMATAFAVEHRVGPGQPLAEIDEVPWESLGPGDVVSIHARSDPYRAKWVICARGTAERPIVVRGVADATGRLPVIDGDGATTRRELNFWGESRAIVKIGGANRPGDLLPAHVVIESLDITGARPPRTFTGRDGRTAYDSNAAAVFLEKGEDITIRGCVLRECGNGLFVSPQSNRVTVEGCHIHDNGIEGSMLEHNAYTQAAHIEYRFNRFGPLRSGCRGNNLKDRSATTIVRANWIEGGNRALDLVDGDWAAAALPQRTLVVGNVLVKLDEEGNNQFVHYGGDSGAAERYRTAPLELLHNTLVSLRGVAGKGSGTTVLLRLSSPDQRADCRGNVIYTTAPGRSLAVFGGEGTVELGDNWLRAGWRESFDASTPDRGRVVVAQIPGARSAGDDPGFVDLAGRDFRLRPGSPCAGAPDIADIPGAGKERMIELPAIERPAADVARVPLDGRSRFTSLGSLPVATP